MEFDAIVGNPPYQIMDGGAQASARPIYNVFVGQAENLSKNYVSMIMPARWYSGGKGLDEFREHMLQDNHLQIFHDFLDPEPLFPGTNIRGGICYFLWSKKFDNSDSMTDVFTHDREQIIQTKRHLKVPNCDLFIRHGMAINILSKVSENCEENIVKIISPRKPFGIESNITKTKNFAADPSLLNSPVKCLGKAQTIGYIEREAVRQHYEWIDRWKVFIQRANNIGTELNDDNLNTIVGEPGTVCTESYIVVGIGANLDEVTTNNLSKYLRTKFVRFMHSLAKSSQDSTSKTFKFVPLQNFTTESDIDWNKTLPEIDEQLYSKYRLTGEEIAFIESMVKSMG